ncbi:germ cell-less protein-like 1 [Fukomys damarensis]|uniref:Germ cell-less protein-like 1 n=1 Tax=Fukomys damarensis TaxID=885580 RepID=A0A091CL84_FUKDA|nr:germ cell-less protein-like 1 [Fukomys damarensis]KFO18532.1 Germ cell-less protein-like 1 [Fukomys damarensis]
MGAISSRAWWLRGRRAPEEPAEEPGAARDGEEAVEAEAALGREEGEVRLTASQSSQRRNVGLKGPLAKSLCLECAEGKSRPIYEALFLRGENSDVQIRALGEEWRLHRVYLCQSGYFAGMFSGAWRETNMDIIEIQIPDENIDREALHEVLGYLYRHVLHIPPYRVIAILATASMLQLEELIGQCEEIMRETVREQTVCRYYYSAENYGLPNIRAICLQWLLDNLLTQHSEQLLLDVSLDLMKELISSSELLVVEVEMDIYIMLKKWMFLQLQPTWRNPRRAILPEADLWFARHRRESGAASFLETEQGRAFVPVFQQLRLTYIICDLPSSRITERDAVIPATWLSPEYREQWLALLQAEQSRQLGPTEVHMCDFHRSSMRCGGQIYRDERCSWKWSGFNVGWDLVVCYINRCVVLCRSMPGTAYSRDVSSLCQRRVAIRIRLVSLDRAGRAIFRKDTGYKLLCLRKDQELLVLNLENQDLEFPIYMACNFMYLPGETGTARGEDPSRRPES